MAKIEPPEEYEYEALPPGTSLISNLLAGAFAGIMEHTVMYPVDAIKTRMQIVNPGSATAYTGIANAVSQISSTEGARALWRGISSVVVGAGPAHAVHFATYEFVKHNLGGNMGNENHLYTRMLAVGTAASCAAIASDALMNPFDVIKQRMQMYNSTYSTAFDCARRVYRHEGIRAFYVSYPTTLAMTIPSNAIQFMAYESLSKLLNPQGEYDPLKHCVSGGLAGAIAAGLTTPQDVIKTMLQTRGNSLDPRIRNCNSLFDAARILNEREGFRGFMRGLGPRIVNAMPSTAICWTSYEMAKYYFYHREPERTI